MSLADCQSGDFGTGVKDSQSEICTKPLSCYNIFFLYVVCRCIHMSIGSHVLWNICEGQRVAFTSQLSPSTLLSDSISLVIFFIWYFRLAGPKLLGGSPVFASHLTTGVLVLQVHTTIFIYF